MSEKVRVAWGMESRRGGGEIPKRLRISQLKEITLDLPFSHCRHAAYVKNCCTKIEKRPNVKTVVEADADAEKTCCTNAAQNDGCATLCTHGIITILQPDIYYLCTHSLIIPR